MGKATKPPIQTPVDETPDGNANGQSNGNGNGQSDAVGSPDPIELAEALRSTLRTAATQAGDLITALRHQKKASKSVHAALASLRQLQVLTG